MADNPWWREHEIANSIDRVLKICESGIFASSEAHGLQAQATFTLLMINLGDVLQYLSSKDRRIAFNDDA